jgi:hypothetical protein
MPCVARTLFVDGIWREVFEEPNGRQYVLDQDAEPVYGVWFIPREMPEPDAIVEAKQP